jgi:hypothetical protein
MEHVEKSTREILNDADFAVLLGTKGHRSVADVQVKWDEE